MFFEKNYSYIDACATCKAIEIATELKAFSDVQDFRQEILLWICRRGHLYNQMRSSPTTFIAMLTDTAKKRILRKFRRKKNWIIKSAEKIEDFDKPVFYNRNAQDIRDFIDTLGEPEKSLCRRLIDDGRLTMTKTVRRQLQEALRPIATEIGVSVTSNRKSVTFDGPTDRKASKRYYRRTKRRKTPGEVVDKTHTLSFDARGNPK